MSTMNSSNSISAATSAAEEVRMLAASQAASTQRRNRPVYLVYIALILLTFSLVWAMSSFGAYRKARQTLDKQLDDAQTIRDNAIAVQVLRDKTSADPERKLRDQDPQFRGRLRAAAVNSGLNEVEAGIAISPPQEHRNLGSLLVRVTLECRHDTLPPLLAWLERCVVEFPGLEVYSVEIRPDAQKWNFKAVLNSWEKAPPR